MKNFNYSKLTVFSDSQHEWLRVPIFDVQTACLQGLEITRFSYMSDKYAYLEGDQDAGAFIKFRGIDEQDRKNWKHSYCNGSSSIRRKERFRVQ